MVVPEFSTEMYHDLLVVLTTLLKTSQLLHRAPLTEYYPTQYVSCNLQKSNVHIIRKFLLTFAGGAKRGHAPQQYIIIAQS